MNTHDEKVVWIDVETTGLDADRHKLLQVACIVTDGDYNELDEGYEGKVFQSATQVDILRGTSSDIVRQMHDANGLWDALPSGKALEEVEQELLSYITQHVPEARTARLGGNSITLDRNFLQKNVPSVFNHIHYWSYDISSVAGMFDQFVPSVKRYEKKATHDALDDIRESIAEGKHYAGHLKRYELFRTTRGGGSRFDD